MGILSDGVAKVLIESIVDTGCWALGKRPVTVLHKVETVADHMEYALIHVAMNSRGTYSLIYDLTNSRSTYPEKKSYLLGNYEKIFWAVAAVVNDVNSLTKSGKSIYVEELELLHPDEIGRSIDALMTDGGGVPKKAGNSDASKWSMMAFHYFAALEEVRAHLLLFFHSFFFFFVILHC